MAVENEELQSILGEIEAAVQDSYRVHSTSKILYPNLALAARIAKILNDPPVPERTRNILLDEVQFAVKSYRERFPEPAALSANLSLAVQAAGFLR